jgi:4-hydroxybenzoate polyprenyltransferase
MMDKALAIISILALIAFMGIVLVFINEIALWVIVCAVLLMAVYDFYVELWRSG